MQLQSVLLRLISAFALLALTACGGCGGGSSAANEFFELFIKQQPQALSVFEDQPASFHIGVRGSHTMRCQWFRNGEAIPGATELDYTIARTTLDDDGARFFVRLSDRGTQIDSATVQLSVQAARPHIEVQPSMQRLIAGDRTHFRVAASGAPPLRYQWSRNGQDIPGATAASYEVPASMDDFGASYRVRVSNRQGSYVDSDEAQMFVYANTAKELIISEIGGCMPRRGGCWFELFNPLSEPLSLSGYQVRSSARHTGTGAFTEARFPLPAVSIPAGGYAVFAARIHGQAEPSAGHHLLEPVNQSEPSWDQSGFVELLRADRSIDFVRFGGATQMPGDPQLWQGESTEALPEGLAAVGAALARPFKLIANTEYNSSRDWTRVRWATPGARNDVYGCAVDADDDGIPSSAKINGGTYGGIDLYAMGARPGQKDIFVQIQTMQRDGKPQTVPHPQALQSVVRAFATKGYRVHFDAGTLYHDDFSPQAFNLGQANALVPGYDCVAMHPTFCPANADRLRSVYDWKRRYMELPRQQMFHYMLFADSAQQQGGMGAPVKAELRGNDSFIALGGWPLQEQPQSALNELANTQAALVMHALGHNLGLMHGGDEMVNAKPNYRSVMNYLYLLPGVGGDPALAGAADRWRYYMLDQTALWDGLRKGPQSSPEQFAIDFSDGSGADLDEQHLQEDALIGHGNRDGSFADWNGDGQFTAGTQLRDLNGDGAHQVLHDANDWARIRSPFRRPMMWAPYGGSGFDPLQGDRQSVLPEQVPAEFFLAARQRMH